MGKHIVFSHQLVPGWPYVSIQQTPYAFLCPHEKEHVARGSDRKFVALPSRES